MAHASAPTPPHSLSIREMPVSHVHCKQLPHTKEQNSNTQVNTSTHLYCHTQQAPA